MQEIYKTIKGFENYEISNLGNVKNNKKGIMMKVFIDKSTGYYKINLTNINGKKKKRIHVLIAQAFIPNPDNKPIVDHIDQNKQNNSI